MTNRKKVHLATKSVLPGNPLSLFKRQPQGSYAALPYGDVTVDYLIGNFEGPTEAFALPRSADLNKYRICSLANKSVQSKDDVSDWFEAVASVTTEIATTRAHAWRLLGQIDARNDVRLKPLIVQLKHSLGLDKDEVLSTAEEAGNNALASIAEPIAIARMRGIQYMREEYQKAENLTLEDASVASGFSDRVLNESRQKGEVYALLPHGKTRGFRYPSWQFNADPERLAAALAPFINANASSWVIHNYMMRSHQEIAGMRGCEYVCDAKQSIEILIHAIEGSLPREHGAS